MHDLVIRGAALFDGTGAPAVQADVAVADGRIVAIGADLGPARETVDAAGLALMPGIIDGHTHYDAQITWDPWVDPSPLLGVTTVVIGNCGFTIAPCRPADRDLTMRNLTQVEGMSLDALRTGIDWDFETFPEYMDSLDRRGMVPNVAAFLGHSSIRTWVMGDDAATRAATDDEITAMAEIVEGAIHVGALGLGSSTNEPHNGEGGVPMPSRLADRREFEGLLGAMTRAGRGLFMLTKGSKTSIAELEDLSAATQRPIVVAALMHNPTNTRKAYQDVLDIRAARDRGHLLTPQVTCCPLTMEFTLRSAYPFEDQAAWQPSMRTAPEALPGLFADPGFRAAVKADMRDGRGRRLFNDEWHKITVRGVVHSQHQGYEGRTIADLAAAAGKEPLDWMLDFALSENLDTLFIAELLNSDETAVAELISDETAHVSLSDAGAHLTFMCDADYGLHLLGHWSRDRGVLSLPEAVRKLTGHPAEIMGIRDRGRIAIGAAADLLLFDPATVGRGAKRRVFDLPAGASRLRAEPKGVVGVWINGRRVVDEAGARADAGRPGRLIREFAV